MNRVHALAYAALFILLSLGIVGWVAWDAIGPRLIAWSPTSDYWEHTAVLHALIEDPIHPRHPLLAEPIPSPRFGPHFVVIAVIARAVKMDALDAVAFAAVLNAALFSCGIYVFFREYFRDQRAPLVALIVLFGSWLDAPHFSNVYKLSVFFSVAGYPSSAALAVMLFGFFVVLRLLRSEAERPGLWALSAGLWAYVYITHPLTAMAGVSGALLFALTEPGVTRRRRLWVAASVPAGLVASLVWPYYPALGMVFSGTADRVQKSLEPSQQHELHSFFEPEKMVDIVGICLLVVLVVPYFVWRRKHLVVPLGALAMLAVFALTAFVDIPLGHRFILLATFFLQIGLVWIFLELLPPLEPRSSETPLLRYARVSGAVATVALLGFMIVSNVETAWERFDGKSDQRYTASPTVKYGRRVAELAGPNAVVLALPVPSWPLPTFGPKIVTLHHQNPLISDAARRNHDARRFLSDAPTDEERLRILERYRVTHVVVLPGESEPVLDFLREHGKKRGLPLGRTLFDVRQQDDRAQHR
jgi:hypothetical protein